MLNKYFRLLVAPLGISIFSFSLNNQSFAKEKKFSKTIDHTNLKVTAIKSDIEKLCDEALTQNFAAVCVQPCFVSLCKSFLSLHNDQDVHICTVIGFPNGYNETKIKVEETRLAIKQGATEIDMVMNICRAKDGDWNYVEEEILQIANLCSSKACVKVIIEASLLTKKEIIAACHICTRANVQYVKTSTGFNGKALIEDVKIIKENIPDWMKIKAAGGIRNLETAQEFLNLGVSRLGTSSSNKLMMEMSERVLF